MRTLGQVMMETFVTLCPILFSDGGGKCETSMLRCFVVTPADGIITSCAVCNPVSMNYISEQYNGYPLFFNCRLKHDIFSMNSHVNRVFW